MKLNKICKIKLKINVDPLAKNLLELMLNKDP